MKQFRYLLAFLIAFTLFISCELPEPTPPTLTPPPPTQPVTGKLVVGTSKSLASGSITKGSVVTVGDAGTALGIKGLNIQQNREGTRTNSVTITGQSIESHTFGAFVQPITPLITIKAVGEKTTEDGLYVVKIPFQRPIADDEFAMAFYYDAATGKLEGIPTVAYTTTAITIATSHFSSIFGSVIKKSAMPNAVGTGFNPTTDGWPFVNYGTYYSPNGICGGMSATAMFAYVNHGGKLAERADNEAHPTNKTPDFWQDDVYGLKYSQFGQDMYSKIFRAWKSELWLKGVEDEITYRSFAYSMLLTGEPQLVRIDRDGGAHAMVVYAIREKQLFVYDPNYPRNTTRLINFKGETTKTFDPYQSAENAEEIAAGRGQSYPYITYAAKTAVVNWADLASGWSAYTSKTIYRNAFGTNNLRLVIRNMKDSLVGYSGERLVVPEKNVKLRFGVVGYTENDLAAAYYNAKLERISNINNYELKDGDNIIGVYLMRANVVGGKEVYDWYGFRWVNIVYSQLDERLFGRWQYTDTEGAITYWQFNPDGTAIQFLNNKSYNWKWLIENSQLKLFIDNGKPAYKTYRIEGNELYFWVEELKIWAVPFKKVS